MNHCSDDDLVLHYYGESAETTAHVAACAACAERARDLATLLGSVSDAVPERGDLYGREVWYRVRPHLDAGGPRFLIGGPFGRGVLVATATLLVATGAFWVGRRSVSPLVPTVVRGPSRSAAGFTDARVARRVLLATVTDHLERSARVLTDIMNAPGGGNLAAEQEWADDLIAANRLYRQDALDADEAPVAAVLEELERALLDIVHATGDAPADGLDEVRRRIESAALLFKVRVLTTGLRERQFESEAPASGHSASPIG